jgi:hypothetical protein
MCIHLLSTAVCTFAEVYTRPYSGLKVDKSIAGTKFSTRVLPLEPRYRFMVTMEPAMYQAVEIL